MTIFRLLAVIALSLTSVSTVACKSAQQEEIPIPPPDPQGKDLVDGAIVAAAEKSGGIRLYKIIHVDDLPDPIGFEYHMIAYDPKVNTFQEAADLRKNHKDRMTVALAHLVAQQVPFMARDHRVIMVEPITEEERAPYTKSRDSRK